MKNERLSEVRRLLSHYDYIASKMKELYKVLFRVHDPLATEVGVYVSDLELRNSQLLVAINLIEQEEDVFKQLCTRERPHDGPCNGLLTEFCHIEGY